MTYVIPKSIKPTDEQIEAMRRYDEARKAPPVRYEHVVVRYLLWPKKRTGRPEEQVRKLSYVEIAADGKVAGDGKVGWERLSGLVVAKDKRVIFSARLNPLFDNADEIAARIS